MHLSIVSPQYLSSNHTAFHPFDRFCPSFDPHHCSANGFYNSQKMISKSTSFVKNHTNSNGSYTRRNSWVARERHEKKASSSTSVIVFCNSHRFLSESTLLLKNPCDFSGFYTRSCAEVARDRYSKGAANAKSGDVFFAIKGNHGNSNGIVCEGIGERDDGFYMRRCVENARKAIGCTSPNPMVGCVIVKNGKIVGEGFHPKAGQPHAEVFALKDAGVLAENATAYVSLEPCNHHGRTPPCTEALIRAKVKHVVVGMVDPNPIVASKGVERLRESGIDVTVGVEEALCRKLNEAYMHRMLTGKPFVTLRYSVSFNGRIMDKLGKGAEESGGYYSQLLQEYDSVIMSSTSLGENSTFPASQEPGANQPLRIIIAAASKLPLHLPAVALEACIPAIVFADKSVVVDPTTAHHLDQLGIETVVLERMDLSAVIDYCGRCGLCSVLLDLRGDSSDFREILETGFEGGLLQKVVMEVCPFWGGTEETSVLACKSLERKSMGLKNLQSWISKGSVVVEGYI